MIRIKK